jgi:hypothetical protein
VRNKDLSCPLCEGKESFVYSQDKLRQYLKCPNCSLIFVPRDELVDMTIEKQRYELHHNQDDDPQYRLYMTKIMNAIVPLLKEGMVGLDFGCGASKILAGLFNSAGFQLESFDLHFFPDEEIWQKRYDFIILSEVIEHLREPLNCLLNLKSLLNAKGQIFIKTKYYPEDQSAFDKWFYKRDITHIQFFSNKAMDFLGEKLNGMAVKEIGEDIYLLFEY